MLASASLLAKPPNTQMPFSVQPWQANSGFVLPGGDHWVQMDTKPPCLPGHRSQTALQVCAPFLHCQPAWPGEELPYAYSQLLGWLGKTARLLRPLWFCRTWRSNQNSALPTHQNLEWLLVDNRDVIRRESSEQERVLLSTEKLNQYVLNREKKI